ncbi:MAG: HlyC/CorC family transporter [Lachnospiraceae bacterium]|uniref:HlyC/CorC family transporter n=1 Tax=Candidatus Weimeria bifida TaxID=2599074 RepID=A0A6N7IYA3_9FIRM|nr:HlyC/CorC family transporter [Candidatus Weimeria bifida]RRF95674.1 MAG: HlyC/CorC family transporter [Lachnospiraceae bacterium]
MGIFSKKDRKRSLHNLDPDITEEELISMVDTSRRQGNILASEAAMIKNIFSFDEKDAKDIMTHRADIEALDGDCTLKDAIDTFDNSHFSRFPVYIKDLDNIIGTIHMKELMHFSLQHQDYDKKIRDIDGLIRKAQFIPETHSINTLFTQMQFEKLHLMIVLDEYGQTSGLVTMEDILEEIVGNIQDEHDEEEQLIIEKGPGVFIMSGKTPLSDVSERLGVDLSNFEDEIETLNGLLMYIHGSVPVDGKSFVVTAFGFKFTVLSVHDRVITKVKVERNQQK